MPKKGFHRHSLSNRALSSWLSKPLEGGHPPRVKGARAYQLEVWLAGLVAESRIITKKLGRVEVETLRANCRGNVGD